MGQRVGREKAGFRGLGEALCLTVQCSGSEV